jgi:hypothetical protein
VILRIKQFIKKASRAEKLSGRVPQNFIEKIKSLSSSDVLGLLSTFTPLDVIALIERYNKKSFDEAVNDIISRTLNSPVHKRWAELVGLQKEEALGEASAALMDKKKGFLTEVLQYGSSSDRFKLSSDKKDLFNIKQALEPISASNSIVVPFCPYDKAFGEKHPLWSIDEDNDIVEGFDDSGRCLNANLIGEMNEEEFKKLQEMLNEDINSVALKYNISVNLLKGLEENKKDLEYQDGVAFLRCTYRPQTSTGKFASLKAALQFQVKAALSSMVNARRKKLGLTLTPKELDRLRILTNSEKTGTITEEEKVEIEALKKRINKNPTSTEVSMDQAIGSDDDNRRSLHDTTSKEEKGSGDVNYEELQDAFIQLSQEIAEEDLKLISQYGTKLTNFLSLMKKESTTSIKSPEKANLKNQAEKELSRVVRAQSKSQCNTCGEVLKEEGSTCPRSEKMRSYLLQSFSKSSTFAEFSKNISSLQEKELLHYQNSGIASFFEQAFNEHSISEDDIDFKLSDEEMDLFKSDSHAPASQKQDYTKTISEALKHLSDQQKRHFFGKDISPFESKEETQTINRIFKVVSKIFNLELEDELLTFILGAGAQ